MYASIQEQHRDIFEAEGDCQCQEAANAAVSHGTPPFLEGWKYWSIGFWSCRAFMIYATAECKEES